MSSRPKKGKKEKKEIKFVPAPAFNFELPDFPEEELKIRMALQLEWERAENQLERERAEKKLFTNNVKI